MRIEIPKPDPDGQCCTECPAFCTCEFTIDADEGYEVYAGPSCPGPGVYELVPEGEVAGAKAMEQVATDAIRELDRLRAENDRFKEALEEIAGRKCKYPVLPPPEDGSTISRMPLTCRERYARYLDGWCSSCLAKEALEPDKKSEE